MSHPLAPYLPAFGFATKLVGDAIAAVDEGQARGRLATGLNSYRGVIAHLVIARHGLCELLDIEVEPLPFGGIGEGFDAGFVEGPEFPSLETLGKVWAEISPALLGGLTGVSEAALRRPSPIPIPGHADADAEAFAGLNVVHESYHAGQLGLMAKAFTGQGLLKVG
ncbi:MAG: DinB family protein [Planctomycetota bacterium]